MRSNYIDVAVAAVLFALLLAGLRWTSPSRRKEKKLLYTGILSINEVRESYKMMGDSAMRSAIAFKNFTTSYFWPMGEPDWKWPK